MAKHKANSKAASRKLSRVSAADYIRLGPDAAAIKSQTSPGRWRQIVKTAHAQGWTVASALDAGTPAALKQRTQSSIRSAAERQVKDAYAPAYAELDNASKGAEGLRQKRISDQAAYDQWASQKASELAGSVNAAQAKYLDTIKASGDAAIADANQTAQGFAAKAGAGGISDLSGSTANAAVARSAEARKANAEAATANAAAQTPIVAERAAAIPLAAMGAAYQRRSQIEGDYNKSMSDIFSGKLKLNSGAAKDQLKAYGDLLQTEMDKASSNRDYAGLQSQLQSKEDIAKLQHQEFLLGNKTKVAGQKLAASTTRRGQTLSHQDRISQRTFDATQKALDRASREKIAATSQKGKARGPAAKKASIAQVQAIKSLATAIKAGVIIGPDGKRHNLNSKNRTAILMGMGASTDQINVATRLTHGRRGRTALFNPGALGILPEDVGLLGL